MKRCRSPDGSFGRPVHADVLVSRIVTCIWPGSPVSRSEQDDIEPARAAGVVWLAGILAFAELLVAIAL